MLKIMKYMKLSAISLAMALAVSTALYAEPVPQAESPYSVDVFGEFNHAFTYDTKTDANAVDGVNGTFLGLDLTTKHLFGKISADIDISELGGSDALSTRDAYIGTEKGPVTISFGRMMNMRGKIREATVGIFEGPNDFNTQNTGRKGYTFKTLYTRGDMTYIGTVSADGYKDNSKDLDSWELGTSYTLSDDINIVSGFAKDERTGFNTLIGGVRYDFTDTLTIGGSYEREMKDAFKLGSGTFNLVADKAFGKNSLKGGMQMIEGDANTFLVEGVRNFNASSAIYANVQHTDTTDAQAYSMGFRMKF
tara:strand:- start:830 stop:1750 length:921 start_codon:yes stop_codon:yes gene_type:complete